MEPNDYTGIHIDVHFEPNQLVATQRVTIVNDKLIEGPECFRLTLIEPNGAYGIKIGSPSSTTVVIKDDDCTNSVRNLLINMLEIRSS